MSTITVLRGKYLGNRFKPAILTFTLVLISCFTPAVVAEQKLKILTSIRPLSFIVQELAGGVADVDVLLTGMSSPHHYAMKFSDKRKVGQSDLVVWVGPALEAFLEGSLKGKNELHMVKGDHGHEGHVHTEHIEAHPWLNPVEVAKFAKNISVFLEKESPGSRVQLGRNLARFLSALEANIEKTEALLSTVKTAEFVSYHAGFHELAEFYNLKHTASLTSLPQQQVGTGYLYKVKSSASSAKCLLVEQGESNKAQGYAELLDLNVVVIDILATDERIKDFSGFQQSIASQLYNCLGGV